MREFFQHDVGLHRRQRVRTRLGKAAWGSLTSAPSSRKSWNRSGRRRAKRTKSSCASANRKWRSRERCCDVTTTALVHHVIWFSIVSMNLHQTIFCVFMINNSLFRHTPCLKSCVVFVFICRNVLQSDTKSQISAHCYIIMVSVKISASNMYSMLFEYITFLLIPCRNKILLRINPLT